MHRNRKVLLTGAAGRIGSTFFKATHERFTFRLTDLPHTSVQADAPHEVMLAELGDVETCRGLCEGIDTVVHLAGIPSPDATFEAVLEHNIKVTHNVFEAARTQGCKRVVVASSAQAVEAYPVDIQVSQTMPVRPKNLYGVSKCFVEALASYYATEQGLSAIAVRIGAFESPESHNLTTARDLSAFLSPRDACHLFTRCIEVENVEYFVAHGVSNNRFKRLDTSETEKVLSYRPADDAFQLFDLPIDSLTITNI